MTSHSTPGVDPKPVSSTDRAAMARYWTHWYERHLEEAAQAKKYAEDCGATFAPSAELRTDDHVGWCRYIERTATQPSRIVMCASESPGAFKVYRHPACAPTQGDAAVAAPLLQQIIEWCEHEAEVSFNSSMAAIWRQRVKMLRAAMVGAADSGCQHDR